MVKTKVVNGSSREPTQKSSYGPSYSPIDKRVQIWSSFHTHDWVQILSQSGPYLNTYPFTDGNSSNKGSMILYYINLYNL